MAVPEPIKTRNNIRAKKSFSKKEKTTDLIALVDLMSKNTELDIKNQTSIDDNNGGRIEL